MLIERALATHNRWPAMDRSVNKLHRIRLRMEIKGDSFGIPIDNRFRGSYLISVNPAMAAGDSLGYDSPCTDNNPCQGLFFCPITFDDHGGSHVGSFPSYW